MKTTPIVSILIPVFNRQTLIADCIQSALDQTYTNFEIVVVDNASDDGTWQICQSFAQKDKRIRIFRNPENIGPVRNWIRCAQEAHGNFCKILFSDDRLEPNCLAKMVPHLEDPDVALVYCSARIGKTREDARVAYALEQSIRLSSTRFLNLVLHGQAPVSPGAVLIRRGDLLSSLRTDFPTATPRPFDQHGAGPDVMISLLTADRYPCVMHVADSLAYFRIHAGSLTIENLNSQVALGYRSALSHYLRNKKGYIPWVSYLARTWLGQSAVSRKWIKPKSLLIEFEGRGSFTELCAFAYYVFLHLAGKAIGKRIACVR